MLSMFSLEEVNFTKTTQIIKGDLSFINPNQTANHFGNWDG